MEAEEYIGIFPGYRWGHHDPRNRITRIETKPKLAALFRDYATALDIHRLPLLSAVQVRDEDGLICDPPNQKTHRALEKELRAINDEMANHLFTINKNVVDNTIAFLKAVLTDPASFCENFAKKTSYSNNKPNARIPQQDGVLLTFQDNTGIFTPNTDCDSNSLSITRTLRRKAERNLNALLDLEILGKDFFGFYDMAELIYFIRIYNNGRLDQGGRIFFNLQYFPQSSFKLHLRSYYIIDEEPTIELDYGAQHLRMVYALEGIDYREPDPFTIPGINFPRGIVKAAMYTLLNAKTYRDAQKSITRDTLNSRPGAVELIKRITAAFPEIADYLHSGYGIRLQNRDSNIAVKVVKVLLEQGYGIIPIHDSFVVPKSAEAALRDAMTEAYLEDVGYTPIIKEG